MITDSRYSRFAGRPGTLQDGPDTTRDEALVASIYRHILMRAERACCCTAKPAVLVVMPTSATRPHRTELLFCMHHYRASRRGLGAAGALAVGADGRQLGDIRDREYNEPVLSVI